MKAAEAGGSITGTINFLARLPMYASEKPYVLLYTPSHGCPTTNIKDSEHQVKIEDMRNSSISYDSCGFQFRNMSSAMSYESYRDESLVESVHLPEVAAFLQKLFKARSVHSINYGVRELASLSG